MSADPTFRSYKPEQAASYAAARSSYNPKLYEEVLSYHTSTGGSLNTLLDVGCGPGNATRDLAQFFQTAVGVDPGEEMISQATEIGGTSKNGKAIDYLVCEAEKIGEACGIDDGSVDLLIAAMSAHWFRMDEFWRNASKILNSGGTVALWTCSSLYCHPSTPSASKVQAVLSYLEDGVLAPYELPSNRLSRKLYEDLQLPWDIDPPISSFNPTQFVRKEWNRDGRVSAGEDFFSGGEETTLEELERSLGTASMVTRWREANYDLAGTEKDCVRMTIDGIKKVLGEDAGSESAISIKTGCATALLLFKKSGGA